MKTFVLGHQRSGSSNLTRFIAAAYSDKSFTVNKQSVNKLLSMEPFAPKAVLNATGQALSDISLNGFNEYILKVANEKNTIKHIYGNHYFIYDELVIRQFVNTHKIVLIYRENVEVAALSHLIATISKNWGEVDKSRLKNSKGISINELRKVADKYATKIAAVENYLNLNSIPFFKVKYEDFYNLSHTKNLAIELLEYLGGNPQNFNSAFEEFLSPVKKINTVSSYSLIPNIKEICKEFPNISKVIR